MGVINSYKMVYLTFIALTICTILTSHMVASDKGIDSAKSESRDSWSNKRRDMRSIYGFGPRMLQISRSKIPIELDLLVENDDGYEKTKRFDDYGHLRFGKRGGEDQFDDYGHMRFGRSSKA